MELRDLIYNNIPVSAQNLLISCYGMKIFYERNGLQFRKLLKRMNALQWEPRAVVELYQLEMLKHIIKHASLYVPFYRNYMKKNNIHYSDIKKIEDIKCFPVVTKGQMKEAPLLFRSEKKQLIDHGHTSGTTGTPFNIVYSRNTSVAMAACDWRHMRNCGRDRKEKIAIFLGRIIVPFKQGNPPFWRHNYVHNEVWFSAFHLSQENMHYYIEQIKKMGINYIKAYPSTAYILAKFCLEHGEKCKMKGILTSSETLFDHQRASIEKAFECKIFDYYGHAERVLFATECEHHVGMHVNEDFGIVECLSSENTEVQEGDMGFLVGTSLYNYAMPFIRYRTGDISSLNSKPCPCGRSFLRMSAVTTKAEDIIVTPDGRLISSSVLTHPFKPIDTIEESQIIQEKVGQVIIKLVVSEKFTPEDQNILENGLRERLGSDMRVSIFLVDKIEREENGKFRWVVSKVGISPYKNMSIKEYSP